MKYEIMLKLSTFLTLFTRAGILKSVYLKILQGRKTNRKALGISFCNMIIIFDVRSTCIYGKKIRRSRGTCDENKHTVTPSFYYIFCSVLLMAVNCAKFEKYGNY